MLSHEIHRAEDAKSHRPWCWAGSTAHLVLVSQQLLAEHQAGNSHQFEKRNARQKLISWGEKAALGSYRIKQALEKEWFPTPAPLALQSSRAPEPCPKRSLPAGRHRVVLQLRRGAAAKLPAYGVLFACLSLCSPVHSGVFQEFISTKQKNQVPIFTEMKLW